ncbi:pyridoxal-phosphate dependent enzyme [Bradyrhizobium manausense]|uniref:threonine ammonia-lyase n=1 Tax=Bradyrhizobium manausense TaxID=989370 RepID=UPI001BA4B5D9|nr:pyridoxal-phosphate dependent enzyme [Bradyrhizobium manausense]MBR0837065.1 pyridoxal-phosphate dependent enzyme [Bradyrhizobium manausense]
MVDLPFNVSEDDLEFITRRVVATPIRSSAELDARMGRTICIKDETVQHSGSFKFRGAILAVRNAVEGVVAAGAGNFPIAVGLAAQVLDKRACLIMPDDAPAFKKEQAQRTGAEIRFARRAELAESALFEAKKRNWNQLHPFESLEMIVGSYTLGLEIASAIQNNSSGSDAVVVACGGGGLATGVALALRSRTIDAPIYVAEPETHQRYARARELRKPVRISASGETICDALQSRQIGTFAFEALEKLDVRLCAVDDRLVTEASALLRRTCNMRVEPSGALTMGAALGRAIDMASDRLWVVACGGNASALSP